MKLGLSLCLCFILCWGVASAKISYEKVSFETRKSPRQEGFGTCVCGFTLVTHKLPIKDLEKQFSHLKRHRTCVKHFGDICELPNICVYCIFKMTICCKSETGLYKCSHGHITIKNDEGSFSGFQGRPRDNPSPSIPSSNDPPPYNKEDCDSELPHEDGKYTDWKEIGNSKRMPVEDYGVYLPVIHLHAGVGQPQGMGNAGNNPIWDADEYYDEDFKEKTRAPKMKPKVITVKPEGDEETSPEETSPEETSPEETSPEETSPEETSPEETSPEETSPEETSPQETTPEDEETTT